ncbi:hypothetical protein T02_12992 [Trichinella nativa]|uniref:Uncharacterized protein n=1 Tax=Trichinella nativa TaxID=6335 RepID=A0A0V1LJH5_9BILA|nr:hypothetical protein T02_12992 [Trichinella nativa]
MHACVFVIRRFACSCNGTRPAAGRRSERPEPASTLLFTCLCAASAMLFNTGRACSHPSWLLVIFQSSAAPSFSISPTPLPHLVGAVHIQLFLTFIVLSSDTDRQTDRQTFCFHILFIYLFYDNDAMLINVRWILTTAPFEPHHRVCVCGWKWKFRFKRWGGRPVGYDQP